METLDFNPLFQSEYGWHLSLPAGWERLEDLTGSDPFVRKPHPIVFSTAKENWALSLTWMTSALPPEESWWLGFSKLVMLPGSVDRSESQLLVDRVFPLIGHISDASSVTLPDGNRALEITEAIRDESTGTITRYGYQLLMPLWPDEPGKVYVQRLVFYADKERFNREIEDIKASARSLSYSF